MVEPTGPYLLGIDIGGSGAKAAVFSLDGSEVGHGYHEYEMISTLPGQAEHDAEGWWQAAVYAIEQATRDIDTADILSIGVGCTNGLIAVDREGQPLRSAIMLWDQRTLPEVETIRRVLDADEVFKITGNPVAPGAFSLPTMLWLKHHDPQLFAATHKLMVPGGYLVARLTGEFTIDFSRASTTLLFDIEHHRWHTPFLETTGIPLEKLPKAISSHEIAGHITDATAKRTGLRVGTPVVAGCMDTIGASIGFGAIKEKTCFIIMGTAARVASTLSSAQFDRRFMNSTHVLPERWLTIGAINGVGSSLRWVRDTFGEAEQREADRTGKDVYDLLTAQAAQAPPGSKGLVFLPYLSGERTPIWNPYARGVFFGATLGHNRNDFLRSVLEGAALAIRHVVEILETEHGLDLTDLKIGGAAAGSHVWNQIIADVLGKKVISCSGTHVEVLGAAILAGVGVAAYNDYDEAFEQTVTTDFVFQPNTEAHATYDQLFPLYKELYLDVEPYFERLAKLDLPQVWVTPEEIASIS